MLKSWLNFNLSRKVKKIFLIRPFASMVQEESKVIDYAKKYRRKEVEDLLKRKFYYIQSFEIYNGQAGLFDFGPPGCALKNNLEQLWRNHFILEDDLCELSATCLTPEQVLKASGHVDKFADFMLKDAKNGNCVRADKYLEEKALANEKKFKIPAQKCNEILDSMEGITEERIKELIKDYKIKSVDGNELTGPFPFNLMFSSMIGPTGKELAYLRPETAQGIFMNFRRMLEYNYGRLPFGGAQIGLGFRNEIAPRSGLLRCREFPMAEIEFFYDPTEKEFPKFSQVADLKLPLLKSEGLVNSPSIIKDLTLKEAMEQGILNNPILAYFLGRSYLFLTSVGIREEGIRFRQHTKNEMAHYACDCWDAEVETSYGWIQIAGHADRTCFDLANHQKHSKKSLKASSLLPQPITEEVRSIVVDKKKLKSLGKVLRKSMKDLEDKLEAYIEESPDVLLKEIEEKQKLQFNISVDGNLVPVQIPKDWITVKEETVTVRERKFFPHVIEPSFGIGRILYCIFEHCFHVRPEDQKRTYFTFPPHIAPVKCSILPLTTDVNLLKVSSDLKMNLTLAGISSKVDQSSQSIGKRYARTDELGIPFGITVDFKSLKDETVTLRDLHSTKQTRLAISELREELSLLLSKQKTWEALLEKNGEFIYDKDESGVGAK